MGKTTDSTTLKEQEEMSPTLAKAIIRWVRSAVYRAHRAHKLNPPPSRENTPGFAIWGSVLVRYVIVHHLKEMEPNHSRQSALIPWLSAALTFALAALSFTFPKACEKTLHSAWSTCHPFFLKHNLSPISFEMIPWFVQKGPPKGTLLQIPHSQLSASFNATRIISVLYPALVINLFIVLCLPSLSAQWPFFGADASYIKEIRALPCSPKHVL